MFATKETEVWMPSKSSLVGNEKNIQGDTEDIIDEASEYYDFTDLL